MSKLTPEKILEYNEKIKNLTPSEIKSDAWLHVFNPNYKKTKGTFSGKWCIIASVEEIDLIWPKVISLVEKSKYARAAKVRTGYIQFSPFMFSTLGEGKTPEDLLNLKENPDPERVICIYVSDYRNKEKVFGLEKEIRKLCFKKKLVFKTDTATKKGIYSGDEKEFLYISEK